MTATATPTPSSNAPAASTTSSQAKKSNKSRRMVLFTVIALIVAGIWFAVTKFQTPATIELSGLVQANEVRNASRFGGRVIKIYVKEGDTVKAGQTIIQFDAIDLKTKIADAQAALTEAQARRSLLLAGADRGALKQASAHVEQANQQLKILTKGASLEDISQAKTALSSAKLKLESAEAAYKNSNRMVDEGIISQQKFQEIGTSYEAAKSQYTAADASLKAINRGARPEDIRIAREQVNAARGQYQQLAQGAKRQDLQIADAAVDQAKSNLEALQSQLSEVTLKAPIGGVVSTLSVSEGELVAPGRPVLTIIDPKNLWADVYVPEGQLDKIQVNHSVKVVPVAIPDIWFDGKVSSISVKSEFVPDGEGTKGKDVDEQASFKVKVAVDGNKPAHDVKTGADVSNTFLRAGMTVHVELQQ